jgi:hypothetical protein
MLILPINIHMESTSANGSASPEPAKGLPAVAPPSGRFIIQLFLVPGLIVAVVVLGLLGIGYLFGSNHGPEHFLNRLKDNNPDVRWRGASDLAQDLKRPENVPLRSDAKFALDLAEHLQAALADLNQAEKETAARIANLTPGEKDLAWKQLAPKRDLAQYLAAALGDFLIPVGVPLLCDMAVFTKFCGLAALAVGVPLLCDMAVFDASPDRANNILQRRKAVWALGNLGENIKGFHKLPDEQQAAIRDFLNEEAKSKNGRARWAANALFYLQKQQDTPVPAGIVAVDRILEHCAKDDDRYLRAQVALVLNFWDSPLVEPLLLELARDDGHGSLPKIPD